MQECAGAAVKCALGGPGIELRQVTRRTLQLATRPDAVGTDSAVDSVWLDLFDSGPVRGTGLSGSTGRCRAHWSESTCGRPVARQAQDRATEAEDT